MEEGFIVWEARQFSKFLEKQRKIHNITQVQLLEGLFENSMISKIESGDRLPEKVMQERLMGRLGESSYEYEMYVSQKDYEHWKKQMILLNGLDNGNLELLERELEEYNRIYDNKNRVMKQFSLMIQLNLMEQREEDKDVCFEVLKEAVYLTIPMIEEKELTKLVLSVEE